MSKKTMAWIEKQPHNSGMNKKQGLCDLCGQREATVHITQTTETETRQVHLCERCAKVRGLTDPTGFSLAELLSSLAEQHEVKGGANRRK